MIRADSIKRDVLSQSLTTISQLLTFNLQQHVRFRVADHKKRKRVQFHMPLLSYVVKANAQLRSLRVKRSRRIRINYRHYNSCSGSLTKSTTPCCIHSLCSPSMLITANNSCYRTSWLTVRTFVPPVCLDCKPCCVN